MKTATRAVVAGAIALGWVMVTLLNCRILPKRESPRVEVEVVQRKPLPLLVRASGNLNPKDSNTVKSLFEGLVDQKLFREGDEVHKGQTLLILKRNKIRLEYQTKKDALENAITELAKARKEVRLQRALFKKQAVAYSAVEDSEAAVIKAQQGLRTAQEAFDDMQTIWNSATVVSPLDGTVVKDWVGEDKSVASGKELVTVADVSEFTVKAQVDELDIRSVHETQGATIRLPVFGSAELPGKVTQIGTAPEGGGLLAIPVTIRILSTKGLPLRPKLTAEVSIFTGRTEPVLSVPAEAITNADGENRLWALDGMQRLRARKVELGRSNPDRVEVVKGISAGERVVRRAEPDFSDGMHVLTGASAAAGRSKTHALLDRIPIPPGPPRERPKPPQPH